jgi:hypothetical protein
MISKRDWRYTHTDGHRPSLNSPRLRKLVPLWMELHQGMFRAPVACQQPFNTVPKLPTDLKQDLRPNFNFVVKAKAPEECGRRYVDFRTGYLKIKRPSPTACSHVIRRFSREQSLRPDRIWS